MMKWSMLASSVYSLSLTYILSPSQVSQPMAHASIQANISFCPCDVNILFFTALVSLSSFSPWFLFISLHSSDYGGYEHVKNWLNVETLLSMQNILVPMNVNKKYGILIYVPCSNI